LLTIFRTNTLFLSFGIRCAIRGRGRVHSERVANREESMTERPRKVHIELALTPRQKRQIREATGREVNTLELRLAPLPRPAGPPAREEEESGFGTTDDHTPRRKR
jgi:hypothetical protein